jgi:hypothetical protein
MKHSIVALVLTWFALTPALAAAPGASSANYEVEVLVFETQLPDLEGSELWTKAPKPVDATAITAEQLAPTNDFNSMLTALHADNRFRVLLHMRWAQTAEAKSNGPPMQLATANDELSGTLKFYLSRFLHLELNVSLQPQTNAGVPVGENAPSYSISEQRRVKSNELNYFDHPKFGVLVRVSPVSG